MKYNIDLVTDYLKELTGCRIRILAHTKNDDDNTNIQANESWISRHYSQMTID